MVNFVQIFDGGHMLFWRCVRFYLIPYETISRDQMFLKPLALLES